MHSNQYDTRWTEEKDQFLRRHYNRDLSASQIAKALGVTRNSVIGRARRMKLGEKQAIVVPFKPKEAAPMVISRARTCQWIDGDPRGDHTYCGEPLKEGSRFSYCEEHHKVVFRKPIPKEDRQHFKFGAGR